MGKQSDKVHRLARRKRRVRKNIQGTSERPRLSVHRSLRHISAQIIDDTAGKTLAAASSVAMKTGGANKAGAQDVGKAIAEKAKAAGIGQVQFDRNGRLFHGRIKALADAVREAGLKF